MKLKFLKLVLPCCASLMMLAGCNGEEEDPFKNDTYVGTYYDGYDLTKKTNQLQVELQKQCFDKHSVFVKYTDFRNWCSYTASHISVDAAPSDYGVGNRNEYFYTGKVNTGIGTREHVWPCANSANLWVHDSGAGSHYVDGNGYVGGGSDLYHIRPSSSTVNTARGNSKYVDFDDPEFNDVRDKAIEVGDGGPYKLKVYGNKIDEEHLDYADRAEPADAYKGDIARILVYVFIHYGYRGSYYNHEDMIGKLNLQNVIGYTSQDKVYQKLVEWNEMDPPSDTEIWRNDTVERIQGNRNPFVDHPSLLRRALLGK